MKTETAAQVEIKTSRTTKLTAYWKLALGAALAISSLLSAVMASMAATAKTYKFGYIVGSIDVSSDDRLIAAGGDQEHYEYGGSSAGRVSVWDANTGKRLWRHDMNASVSFVAFSPHGDRLYCVSDKIYQYSAITGRKMRSGPLKEGYSGVALSGDGRYLACVPQYLPGPIIVYDLTTTRITLRLSQADGYSDAALAFTPNGKIFAIGRGGSVVFMDPANGRKLKEIDEHGFDVSEISFVSNGTRLAVQRNAVGNDRRFSIDLRDTASGASTGSIHPEIADGVRAICISPPGDYVGYWVNQHEEYGIGIWSVLKSRLFRTPLRAATADIFAFTFGRSGTLLAAGGDDRVVWVWKVSDIVIAGRAPNAIPTPSRTQPPPGRNR